MKTRIALTITLLVWAAVVVYFGYLADAERTACAAEGGTLFYDGCYKVTREKIK